MQNEGPFGPSFSVSAVGYQLRRPLVLGRLLKQSLQ
jgi:hypothetical protein